MSLCEKCRVDHHKVSTIGNQFLSQCRDNRMNGRDVAFVISIMQRALLDAGLVSNADIVDAVACVFGGTIELSVMTVQDAPMASGVKN